MRIHILAAGRPALAYAKQGVAEYLKRLTRYGTYELIHLKAGDSESVSQSLLERSAGSYRIALDERGAAFDTCEWAKRLEDLELRSGIKTVSFLIGASDGHTPALRDQVDAIWSLSRLTLQHELALVVLLEQIYRVATYRRGEPYHRS